MYVYVCECIICVCVCVVCIYACVHKEARGRQQLFYSVIPYLILFREGLTEPEARLAASKSKGPSQLCLPRPEITGHWLHGFYISSGVKLMFV